MNNTSLPSAALLNVTLDRASPTPMFEQLVQTLRALILEGQLDAGSALPSSRKFAVELSVSRVTINTAYDQLIAEGYIESRAGSGVFVTQGLPVDIQPSTREHVTQIETRPEPKPILPFQTVSPDMGLFPHKVWGKLLGQVWSNPEPGLTGQPDPLGWWPLRYEICRHLKIWRGISCKPSQVLITSGASQATGLIIAALLNSGDTVAIENPGYKAVARVFQSWNIKARPVPVDENGLVINQLEQLKPAPAGVITTPSRQFPLGQTLPLSRRLQMLGWLEQDVLKNRFIVEDDFDSEYRFTGRPLPALASLAPAGNVIYMGSFSKVFSKALRMGFMVVPENLLPQFTQAMTENGGEAAFIAQPVLARFMESGAYAAHIRKMRRIYARRQKTFLQASRELLSDLIEFEGQESGMHLVGRLSHSLAQRMSDVEVCELARRGKVDLAPLSAFYHAAPVKQGIIAGFAGSNEGEQRDALVRLASVLKK